MLEPSAPSSRAWNQFVWTPLGSLAMPMPSVVTWPAKPQLVKQKNWYSTVIPVLLIFVPLEQKNKTNKNKENYNQSTLLSFPPLIIDLLVLVFSLFPSLYDWSSYIFHWIVHCGRSRLSVLLPHQSENNAPTKKIIQFSFRLILRGHVFLIWRLGFKNVNIRKLLFSIHPSKYFRGKFNHVIQE